jgi:hypothetical protein
MLACLVFFVMILLVVFVQLLDSCHANVKVKQVDDRKEWQHLYFLSVDVKMKVAEMRHYPVDLASHSVSGQQDQ